jgi:hypothetical protein
VADLDFFRESCGACCLATWAAAAVGLVAADSVVEDLAAEDLAVLVVGVQAVAERVAVGSDSE